LHPLNDLAKEKARLYVELTDCQIVGICRESFKPAKKQIIPEALQIEDCLTRDHHRHKTEQEAEQEERENTKTR
jgi:hypothetical protein